MQKLHNIQLVISDWSGVFSDDRLPVYESNMRVIEKHGKKRVSFDEWLPVTRLTPIELFSDFGVTGDHDLLFEEYRQTLNAVRNEGIHPVVYQDAMMTLKGLLKRKLPIVIVSSHPEKNLIAEAEEYGIKNFITTFYGNAKDKTEEILKVAATYNLSPGSTLYMGDTIYDIQAAKKAKVHSIGVATGYHVKERLISEKPDVVLDSLFSLLDYI